MISCFPLRRKTEAWRLNHLIITLLVTGLLQFCKAEDIVHYTESTNCKINFQLQESASELSQLEGHQLKFKHCVRKVCQSYQANGLCRSEQEYNLEEWKCMRQCCGAQSFDFLACSDYNQLHEQRRKQSVGAIVAGLSISITGLLIAAIIFAIKYIKCCPKKQASQTQSLDGETQRGKIVHWKPCEFHLNYQCFECKEQEASVMLPCGKIYHLNCLESSWQCSHCSTPITKLKFYCSTCLKCSVMVRAESWEETVEKVGEAYSWHPHRCSWQAESLESDRKLTAITAPSP